MIYKIMQMTIHKEIDSKGSVTFYGVYKECLPLMNERLDEVNYGVGRHIKSVSFRVFCRIIKMYVTILLQDLLTGRIVNLYNRFGNLYIVKTKAVRYNPTTYTFTKVNGKVVRRKVPLNLSRTIGFVFFAFWNCPKRYRHYRLKVSKVWKTRIKEVCDNGLDVMDISLFKYGRTASPTYIQKIK